MDWSKLDIRKASILKKEVDHILSALKESIDSGDVDRRSALLNSVAIHIDSIEEFRSLNDGDERAILFERERLRLRKAVQDYGNASTPLSGSSKKKNARGGMNAGSPGKMNPPKYSLNADAVNRSASMNSNKHESIISRTDASSPTHNLPSAGKNIYSWETEDGDIPKERRQFAIEGATFSPSSDVGVYVRDDIELDNTGGAGEYKSNGALDTSKYMDVYFVLNAEEVSILASRLQRKKAADTTHYKSQTSAAGVQHSTPFIDAFRIEKSLYRPEQKEKWIGAGGLRPNAR